MQVMVRPARIARGSTDGYWKAEAGAGSRTSSWRSVDHGPLRLCAAGGSAQSLSLARPLDDLGPELADTVANVYYRYALATGTVSNLALALGTAEGDELTAEIGVIIAQQEYVDDMVKAVRRAGR